MTHSLIYRVFAVAFFWLYCALPCAPVHYDAYLGVLYVFKSAFVGHFSSILCIPMRLIWPQIVLCWRFSNPVHSQWPKLAFVGHLLILWLCYVRIAVSLSGIFYSLESIVVGRSLLLRIFTWMPYYLYCKSINWHLNAILFLS